MPLRGMQQVLQQVNRDPHEEGTHVHVDSRRVYVLCVQKTQTASHTQDQSTGERARARVSIPRMRAALLHFGEEGFEKMTLAHTRNSLATAKSAVC